MDHRRLVRRVRSHHRVRNQRHVLSNSSLRLGHRRVYGHRLVVAKHRGRHRVRVQQQRPIHQCRSHVNGQHPPVAHDLKRHHHLNRL